MTTKMTYVQAAMYIQRLQDEMPEHDTDPAWSVKILAEPVAEWLPGAPQPPDMQKPEWMVQVAWYCAAQNDLSTAPSEYGMVLTLDDDRLPTASVYAQLEHGMYTWLRQRMHTYRSTQDAVAANN
jgi:hypothetical protein